MAIQLIINHEWGLAKNENPNQGCFIIEELTDLVEEAVLKEFDAIAERGGVLGAMETGYQRGKIQDESLYYERKKHDGTYPIIGVNTFRNPHGDAHAGDDRARALDRGGEAIAAQAARAVPGSATPPARPPRSSACAAAVIANGNTFDVLMDAVRSCSLGQITRTLYEVGGRYRRNM